MLRLLSVLVVALTLAACGGTPVTETPEPLGDFRLGFNIVQTGGMEKGPFSRELPDETIRLAVRDAVEARLGRYDGDGLYDIGIAIGGYVLAQPGLPVVYTPKSAIVLEVNVYENATQTRLNPETKRIIAMEEAKNYTPLIGSGLVRDGNAQLQSLSRSAAVQIENWLRSNPGWFTPRPGRTRAEISRDELRQRGEAAIRKGN
ncbi:hypothetical protein [Palleronia caenipelagi]|uniref:DUF4136 domain-containing protein n=1 Tax=Palleronia caenipelagi TaxID=2489174 RepID=A0A547PMN4_9RHOB|nr:hypothetical protein [Palleronia caenipelagi]TRD15409.1 hypothetical protein FEV53_16640 [Palleronia caenipelagi]